MVSFKNLVSVERTSEVPIYLQLHNGIVRLIKLGILQSGAKLPGTRNLAGQLGLHRKTVIAAYDELMSQAWIESVPSKGTFVSSQLPEVMPLGKITAHPMEGKAGFAFDGRLHLHRVHPKIAKELTLDEGIPDVRIAPVLEILRHQRHIISRSYNNKNLGYGSFLGEETLRETLARYLQETRGIQCAVENVMITRGSQMGMYLSSQLLHKKGGASIVGETNYIGANLTLLDAGAELLYARVDENGLITHDVERLCKANNVRSVYVTSHHHHPTTVTLSVQRRLQLVELAKTYGFAILEDDYDYDFHYQRAPVLPIASMDDSNHIVYMGALCKIVAPSIRVGYMVGPKDFIEAAGHLRRIIDRQGDALLERAIAQMIEFGDLQRHIRKALKLYEGRRDYFNHLLECELSDFLEFKKPEGGMAFWVKLKPALDLNWETITLRCKTKGLTIPDWKNYDLINSGHNGLRMGFASLTFEEQDQIIRILKEALME